MDNRQLVKEIDLLRKERGAVILAHNYQPPEIQEIADMVGDSFALSKAAVGAGGGTIVFCGVRFMAESAKILSPQKTVLLPAEDAGCPLADCITAEQLRQARREHPGAAAVCYINTCASVKAQSDVCCTSSNAMRVVRSLDEKEILFVPDRNLASYVAGAMPEKKIIPWNGGCRVHSRICVQDVLAAREAHPGALLLVHPEVPEHVRELADFVGSTAKIIDFAARSRRGEFIIGTEEGILEKLRSARPDAAFYMLRQDLICRNMKKTTLQKIYDALKYMRCEVTVPEDVRRKAYTCLNRMMSIDAVSAR